MAKKNIHFFSQDIDFVLKHKTRVRQWITESILSEGFKTIIDLNFIFCGDEYLYQINRQFLNHHTYTDIITFDNSDDTETITGDIFISIDRVRENATQYHVKEAQELSRVMIHGVLHLCGYKDKGKQAKEGMTAKENHYLAKQNH